MTRTRPRRLRPGDLVEVIAPAGPVDPAALDRGVTVLRSWDLDVRVAPHVLDRHPSLPYLAGRDADRAADLHRAWCDPAVAAVVCARGGYGSQRLLDLLDFDAMAAAGPKVFAGSSDVTALHSALGTRLDLVTLFSPMIAGGLFDDPARQHLRTTLFTPEQALRLTGPAVATAGHGTAEGLTVGGTVSLLASDLGTPDAAPAPDGAIALLEDIGEDPYRLDRLLTQLLRAGWFTGVAGIALGSWNGCGEPHEVYEVVADLLGGLGVPMVWELGFGHCAAQLTVPLGVRAVLDADEGTLTLIEPALS